MIDWEAQLKRAEELSGGLKPKDGEVLDLAKLENIEETEDVFTKKDGTEQRVIRFRYIFSDRTLVVPSTLHKKIARIKKEYGDRVTRVKVTVTGEGLATRYDALPVL